MSDPFTRALFIVGGRPYSFEDVVVAADFRGELVPFEAHVAEGLALAERAGADGDPLPGDAVRTAAADFRYDRNLLSGDSMAEWLDEWELTVEAWHESLRRRLLRERRGHGSDARTPAPTADPPDAGIIFCDAVCWGVLRTWAERLAGRAVAAERFPVGAVDAPVEATVEVLSAARREVTLLDLDPGVFEEKLNRVALLESAFQRFRHDVVTPRAVRERVGVRRLDWIRTDLEWLSFAREGEAQEAALCVHEDGLSLAEVASDIRRDVERGAFYLDELPQELRDRFLAAEPGGVLSVKWSDADHRVARLAAKILPSEEAPDIRHRAEEEVLAAAVDREIRDRATWHARL